MKTYSLADVIATLGEILITGTADEGVKVEFNEDLYTLHKGGDGRDNTRVRNNDWTARVTISLKQGASANDLLSAMMLADRFGLGVKPFQLKDLLGSSLFNAARMWIVKVPDAGHGREASTRDWVLETDEMVPFIGGANP